MHPVHKNRTGHPWDKPGHDDGEERGLFRQDQAARTLPRNSSTALRSMLDWVSSSRAFASTSDAAWPVAALRMGKAGWINFAAVGFAWDKAKGQPHLTATLRVLDEDGKPALVKPSRGTIDQDVPDGTKAVPMQFELVLQKAGKFTIELEAVDDVTGEKTSLSLPINVAELN